MKNFYEQDFTVTSSMCDFSDNIRFDAILNIFQDITTEHSAIMGTDHEKMYKYSNAFWVLSKTKFTIEKETKVSSLVKGKTWPLKHGSIRFLRECEISGENQMIRGLSEWCILDATNLSIRKIDSVIYPQDFNYLDASPYATGFLRLNEQVCEEDYVYTYKTTFTDIDANNHVNNVSYSRMALNAFTPQEWKEQNFKHFEINFISQTYFGYEIKIYKKQTETGVYVEGKHNDKTVFKCIFTK